ncbi:MAG: putative ATPase [Candidatus Saganbacteria bacterium]|uniref:Putative ATPase n=1 Tax=Candidatus Saganbacteria bacterium TaxID=2575572 RepID=A0A833L272_UNCSA|nr:MAG: putative ATPase [Candidatus Saganbacteria bacterium]
MNKINRFFPLEEQSFFLFGPRGTGKSTLIKEAFSKAIYIDLLLPDIYRNYSGRPERLKDLVYAQPNGSVFILDEVQKIPEILEVVHSLLEEKKGWQFILTGSSARKLKRANIDLLAGRALLRHLHPFIAAELKELFSLESALNIGLLPVVLDSKDPAETLKSYINLYIREEVHLEGLTRNIGDFSRFLETISFSHGSILNISNVARESQIERKTVECYVNILEDLLIAFRLPAFSKRAKRKVSVHPKFYYFDAGVFRSLRPSGPLDRGGDIIGAALEGLVAQHLRAWIDYKKYDSNLFFWRTSAGSEVDFIVYGQDIFWAIEVKNSALIHNSDLRPLKSFGEEYPEAKKILLYRGKEEIIRNDIKIQPCESFLKELA